MGEDCQGKWYPRMAHSVGRALHQSQLQKTSARQSKGHQSSQAAGWQACGRTCTAATRGPYLALAIKLVGKIACPGLQTATSASSGLQPRGVRSSGPKQGCRSGSRTEQGHFSLGLGPACGKAAALDSSLPKPSSTEIHLGAGMRPFKPWLDFGATAVVRNDPASGTETLKSHTGFCRLLQGP